MVVTSAGAQGGSARWPAGTLAQKEQPMDEERNERPGWVRLPAHDNEDDNARGPGRARASSVRPVRRASTWTAATLIAGLAAAAGYFAHHTQPAVPATTVTRGAPGSASTAGGHKPALPSPVATSSGSPAGQGDDRGDN
jgi:hypothetical protein